MLLILKVDMSRRNGLPVFMKYQLPLMLFV